MLRLLSGRTLTLQHEDQNGRKETKKLEYFFTKVSAPAPKRLIIESHEGGTHSITSTMSDSSDSESDGHCHHDDGSDSGTESEASPGLQDSEEQSHSEQSSGALVSCYTQGFT